MQMLHDFYRYNDAVGDLKYCLCKCYTTSIKILFMQLEIWSVVYVNVT